MAHFISPAWEMQRCVLMTKPFPEHNTSQNITNSLSSCQELWYWHSKGQSCSAWQISEYGACWWSYVFVPWLVKCWVCSSQAVVGNQRGTLNSHHCLCYCSSWAKASASLQAQYPCCSRAKGATGANGYSPKETEAGLFHPMEQHLLNDWASVCEQVANNCCSVGWISNRGRIEHWISTLSSRSYYKSWWSHYSFWRQQLSSLAKRLMHQALVSIPSYMA